MLFYSLDRSLLYVRHTYEHEKTILAESSLQCCYICLTAITTFMFDLINVFSREENVISLCLLPILRFLTTADGSVDTLYYCTFLKRFLGKAVVCSIEVVR